MLSASIPSAILQKLEHTVADVEALMLELAGLLSDRPGLLRRLQLLCGELTLSERQKVANALSRAAKAGTVPTAATTHDAPPPLSVLRAAATSELCAAGVALSDCELLAHLPELTRRGSLPPSHLRVLHDALELGGPHIAFWSAQLTERYVKGPAAV
jgi:hypothetical protein